MSAPRKPLLCLDFDGVNPDRRISAIRNIKQKSNERPRGVELRIVRFEPLNPNTHLVARFKIVVGEVEKDWKRPVVRLVPG